jgi:hypothetical protein
MGFVPEIYLTVYGAGGHEMKVVTRKQPKATCPLCFDEMHLTLRRHYKVHNEIALLAVCVHPECGWEFVLAYPLTLEGEEEDYGM